MMQNLEQKKLKINKIFILCFDMLEKLNNYCLCVVVST